MFAADNLAHYVAGLNVSLHVGFHLEVDGYGTLLREALDHQGIFNADCCGGNLWLFGVVDEGSGVRDLHRQACGRPDEHCRSAFGGNPRGAVGSVLRVHSVAVPAGIEDYDFAFYLVRGCRFERIEAGQKHNRRGDSILWCADAHAQAEHVERPRDLPCGSGVDHRARLATAYPARHHDGLDRYVLQACFAHEVGAPLNCCVQLRSSAEALAYVIAEIGQGRVAILIRLGRLQNLCRVCRVFCGKRSCNSRQ